MSQFWARMVLALALLGPVQACSKPPADAAPEVPATAAPQHTTASFYAPMRDGVRLAVEVHLPAGRGPNDRLPALLELTRYRRATLDAKTGQANPPLNPVDLEFIAHGYAVVKVDARGSGASFGTRPVEYGPEEVRDGYDVVDWVVKQAWSDGNVGGYGTSYTGTTAELLAAVNHPAVKAVIPGWSDFDSYPSPMRPYGLIATGLMKAWSDLVGAMDRNDGVVLGSTVRPVDEDKDGSLLKQALGDHAKNPDVFQTLAPAEYRDDDLGGGVTWAKIGTIEYQAEIERSKVPMLVFVSWLDAGTADGTLFRFRHFSNPQKVLVMAGMHGGRGHASPYRVSAEPLPPIPSEAEQFTLRRKFFDRHLKGERNDVDSWPALRFFNLGEEAFHDSDVWPPAGTTNQVWHLSKGGGIESDAKAVTAGSDPYGVDPTVTTGKFNRWMAQLGEPIVGLDNRGEMDARMLAYTSEPLGGDLQIAGHPVVTLRLASDREDGAVLVYLEDVAPDGRSRYLTEGGLRLIHRKLGTNPYATTDLPYHTFARKDARPMTPGKAEEVTFQLWPIAALIKQGHRIRLAIAGADQSSFDPVPADGNATLTVTSGGTGGSRLVLPVVPGGLRR
ncbi:MAG: CocE/NonD family hydrolase [Gemmatimonadales bacterium]